jgi:DNA-binding MarR family transcriptional regulator
MSYVEDALLLLARAGLEVTEAIGETVGGDDLVTNIGMITMLLLHRDGPQRPTRIAEINGVTSGGGTKLLIRLEQRGLVERSAGTVPEDGRAVMVSLTPAGANVVSEVLAAAQPPIDKMIDSILELRADH